MKTIFEKRIPPFAIAMAFLAWMAVKLPMPALPHLAQVFQTSNQLLQFSITLNLIGFSISQIIWGPLSDRFGRKPALLWAFGVAIVGTILAMLAVNTTMYIAGRLVEGLAVGAAAPVGRAIMADKLEKIKMAKVYAWYAIAALLPPAVGPVIGGYLLVYLGWRTIFAFFLLLALVYMIAVWRWMPETHEQKFTKLKMSEIWQKIVHIAQSKTFWMFAITYALINGFMIAYYGAMPYWYVVHFHLSEDTYAYLAFLPIASYILGSMLTNRLLKKYSLHNLLLVGVFAAILVGVLTLLLAIWFKPSLVNLNIIMILFSVASGIVTPMANASLMSAFREKVTILSAMMSGLRVAGAGVLVLISANIPLKSLFPLGIYITLVALLALGFYRFFARGEAA